MGTIVLGVAGAALGSVIPGVGTSLGWAIGTTLGGVLETMNRPGVKVESGRLSDLRLSGSSYGTSIPQSWGRVRLGGNVIWMAEDDNGNHLVEHSTTESQGGGGGSGGGGGKVQTTTYTYSTSFAVALCAGTVITPDNELISLVGTSPLRRIWADDLVIFDSDDPSVGDDITVRLHEGSEDPEENKDDFIWDWCTAHPTRYLNGGESPAYCGICYLVFENFDLTDFGNRIPNISVELECGAASVGSIVHDVARQNGLLEDEIDSDVATTEVEGWVISDRTTGQDAISSVLNLFLHDLPEVDGVMRPVPRGGSTLYSVPENDLAATTEDSDQPANKLEHRRLDETEMPSRVDFTYYTTANGKNLEQSTQSSTRQTAWGRNNISMSLPVTMSDSKAKELAASHLDIAWTERELFTFSLPPRYAKATCSDILGINYQGSQYRIRITDCEYGLPGQINYSGVLDSIGDLDQTTVVSGGSSSTGTRTRGTYPTTFLAWSGKELRNQDQLRPGFYVAATGDDGWRGATIFYSPDGGTNWLNGGTVGAKSIFGVTTNALANGTDPTSWDNTHSVTVDLARSGDVLTSNSDSAVISGATNSAVVGEEILGFGTVTPSGGNFILSHLRRGFRSSVMTGHSSGERFVLAAPGIVRVSVADNLVGVTVKVKVVSPGQVIGDVTAQDVVIADRTLTQVEQDVAQAQDDIADLQAAVPTGTEGQTIRIGSDGKMQVTDLLHMVAAGHFEIGTDTTAFISWLLQNTESSDQIIWKLIPIIAKFTTIRLLPRISGTNLGATFELMGSPDGEQGMRLLFGTVPGAVDDGYAGMPSDGGGIVAASDVAGKWIHFRVGQTGGDGEPMDWKELPDVLIIRDDGIAVPRLRFFGDDSDTYLESADGVGGGGSMADIADLAGTVYSGTTLLTLIGGVSVPDTDQVQYVPAIVSDTEPAGAPEGTIWMTSTNDQGSFLTAGKSYKSVTGSYTVVPSDRLVMVTVSGTTTVTLPDPSSYKGPEISIGKGGTDFSAIGIATAGSGKTITGTTVIFMPGDIRTYVRAGDGSGWIEVKYAPYSNRILQWTSLFQTNDTRTAAATTEQDFATQLTFPANSIKAGTRIRLKMQGIITTSASVGTLALKHYLNATSIGIASQVGTTVNTGPLSPKASMTTAAWYEELILHFKTVGTTAACEVQGFGVLPQASGGNEYFVSNTAAISINTTIAQVFKFSATWSVNNGSSEFISSRIPWFEWSEP